MSVSVDDNSDFFHIRDVEWKKLRSTCLKTGFVDGKHSGEENSLQEGFNDGYKKGFQSSFQIAVLKGIICALETSLKNTQSDYANDVAELKQELSRLENACLEAEKKKLFKRCEESANSELDKIPEYSDCFNEPDLMEPSNPTICSNSDDLKDMTSELSSIRQKTLKILEKTGNLAFVELVENIW